MLEGARSETIDRETTQGAVKVSRWMPKIATMREIFVPPVESLPTPRTDEVLETRASAIRIEVRAGSRQHRESEQKLQARLEREARQRARIERIRAEALRARQLSWMQREEERSAEQARLAVSVLAVLGTFGALCVAILEGQVILASFVAALESFLAVAPAVLFEIVRGVLMVLAKGDPTLISAAALIAFSLLFAGLKSVTAGVAVRRQRKEYSF